MDNSSNSEATVYGLVSAAVLSNIPPELMTYGEKLIYGAVLALITGFTYAAGGWAWNKLLKKKEK